MVDAYIPALFLCSSFDEGNKLAQVLPEIDRLTLKQVEDLVHTYNTDSELRGSFGFNGNKPNLYGKGLAYHLTRITGHRYAQDETGQIA